LNRRAHQYHGPYRRESITELVRTFGVSRATIYRALQATEQGENPQLVTQPAGT